MIITFLNPLLFNRNIILESIIKLRNIDDTGKLPEKTCYSLDYWLDLAKAELKKAKQN